MMDTYFHSPVNASVPRPRSLREPSLELDLNSGPSFSNGISPTGTGMGLGLFDKAASLRVNLVNDTDLQAAAAAAVAEAAKADREAVEELSRQVEKLRKERDAALDSLLIESSRWAHDHG